MYVYAEQLTILAMEMGKGLIVAMGLWTISNYSSFGWTPNREIPLFFWHLTKGNAQVLRVTPTTLGHQGEPST